MKGAQAKRASVQAGIREPVSGGDDAFIRRSSYNHLQHNAAMMASVPPPPVVDINDYVPPQQSGMDNLLQRKSWTAQQINANIYANVPHPPVVDINDYHPPKDSVGRKSLNADQIRAAMAIPAPPAVDIQTYVPPKMSTDDVFFGQKRWTADQINANVYAKVPPPPPVVVDDYAGHMRRTSGVITSFK